MLLDPSLSQTEYVEDCEICCNPINVVYGFEDKNQSILKLIIQRETFDL